MRLPRILPLLLVALALSCGACSSLATPQFLPRAWQSEDGLPSNVIRAVAQAQDGYLWIGTPEGVVRFDGHRSTPLRGSDGNLAQRRSVRALFTLRNGDVWVTTTIGGLLLGRGAGRARPGHPW